MIIILLLFLLLVALGIFSRVSATAKRVQLTTDPVGYHTEAGVTRIAWALITLVCGVGFPPLWILTILLTIYGIHCFKTAKRLKPRAIVREDMGFGGDWK